MSEINNNSEEENEGELSQHIPQEQLITHLRNFFSANNPNRTIEPINTEYILPRSNSDIHNRNNQINDEEDKDDNENMNNEIDEYHPLNPEEEESERDQNDLQNTNEEEDQVENIDGKP